jgi:hypothetical protein
MMTVPYSKLLATLLAAVAVTGVPLSPAVAKPGVEGLWLSDGYGFFAEKQGATLTLKEITRISCMPNLTAKREGMNGTAENFISRDANSEGGGPAIFKVFAVGETMHILFEGAVSDVVFRRVENRPAVCAAPTPNTPQSNYAVFWQNYADHYPFFKLRNTDWNAVDKQIRPTIGKKTTPQVLFAKLKKMFAPFEDAHTFLDATTLKTGHGGGRSGIYPSRDPDNRNITAILAKKYLTAPLKPYCNKQLQYGVLKDGSAYLRIISFYDYVPDARFGAQAAALHDALDKIMLDAGKRNGLVIDVRTNGGGSDEFGNIIAGRLTKNTYLAYRKVIRNDVEDKGGRTPAQDVLVEASQRPGFYGKVILLTGNDSVSAAETFAMALLGRSDRVIRIGQPTQGVFSDVLKRHMPNGWILGLPNEIYLTENGHAFDGPGLLPDIKTPVFSNENFAKGQDPAVEAAQAVIAGKTFVK